MSAARTFVIGDIHGCVDEIDCLLNALAPSASDTLVFLGDYIDRGPASKGVIERLLRLQHEGPACVFLKGNHEEMFLGYLGWGGLYGDAFRKNGGAATLRSYGLDGCSGAQAAARLPAAHAEFLRGLRLTHAVGRYLCVHAGFRPMRALETQSVEDQLWIREEWVDRPHPYPYTVLFGHTPRRSVLFDLPYKIGLDTGLVYWNQLSCLELSEAQLFAIRRGERTVSRCSVRNTRMPPLLSAPDLAHRDASRAL